MSKVYSVDFLRKKRVDEASYLIKRTDEFWSAYLIRLLSYHRINYTPKTQIDSKGYYEKDYTFSQSVLLKVTRWFEIPHQEDLPRLSLFFNYSVLKEHLSEQTMNTFYDQVSLIIGGLEECAMDFYFYPHNTAELFISSERWSIAGIQSEQFAFTESADYDSFYIIDGLLDFLLSTLHSNKKSTLTDAYSLSS